ncbi:hypothetical protein GCM10029963_59940 [Micromonospora andamanensis]
MTPAELAEAVLAAAHAVFADRGLDRSALPEHTTVERPRNPEHGDYAATLALQLSKKVGLPPRDLAAALAAELASTPGIKSVEIAGPGFLNIRLDAAAAGQLARSIVEAGRSTAAATGSPGSRSTWSSSRPTRQVRCTSVASAGRRSATR